MFRIFFTAAFVWHLRIFNFFSRSLLLLGLLSIETHQRIFAATDEGIAIFDANFLRNTSDASIDVSQFSRGHALQPGQYDVNIVLNERSIDRLKLTVKKISNHTVICITRPLLNLLHIKSTYIDDQQLKKLDSTESCLSLEQLIPAASAHIDISTLSMIIAIPQAALQHQAQNEVDPSLWQQGINALIVNYNANYYQSKQDGSAFNSLYNSNNVGLNIHGFHFRHLGSLSWQNESGTHYQNLRNYVERDISSIRSRITVGDADTSGNLFDSFSFRGLTLRSVDAMLPDSRRGYAPAIRGVAQTHARVSVRQNNVLLYETTVPPGPFSFDDLYPTGYGGDLVVTIRESDGQISQFMVPYASIPQLVRQGTTLFSITAGTLRNMKLSNTETVAQATLQRGVSNLVTSYGGVLTTRNYHAFLLGGAVGTSMGALALDVSQAQTVSRNKRLSGQSYRMTYSKEFNQSTSTVSVAAWRFSSSGYLGLNDAMHWIDNRRRNVSSSYDDGRQAQRSRLSISLSQTLPDSWGQMYLTAIRQNYWRKNGNDNQLQAGYSNAFRSLSRSLSVNRLNSRDGAETQFSLGFSMPLGSDMQDTSMNLNFNHDAQGLSSQVNLSSSLGAEQQFDYNVGVSQDRQQGTSANTVASWHSAWSTLQGSYEAGSNSQSWSGGLSGSLVALPDGMIFSPWYSETTALVDAPYAKGATVEGHSGLKLNDQGRALVPYMIAYHLNEIVLDPQGLPPDVELKSTRQQSAPYAGALVKVKFATMRGRAVLIHSTHSDGQSLPFGATVSDERGNNLGLVAQGDMIYVRLPEGRSRLVVRSGETTICTLTVTLPPRQHLENGFERFNTPCLPANSWS